MVLTLGDRRHMFEICRIGRNTFSYLNGVIAFGSGEIQMFIDLQCTSKFCSVKNCSIPSASGSVVEILKWSEIY